MSRTGLAWKFCLEQTEPDIGIPLFHFKNLDYEYEYLMAKHVGFVE